MADEGQARRPAAGPSLIGVGAVAAAAALLRAGQPVLSGVDPFWHWDLGRRILVDGLPREDPYSFLTGGREWILNQWGTDLIIGLTRQAGGIWLVAVLTALLVGGAMLLTGYVMWRRSPSLITLAALVLVVASTVTNWSLRGNLFTFLMLPLLLVELRRDDGARPWFVVVLMVVWANLHAAFLLGVALVILDTVAHLVVAADRRAALRRAVRLIAPAAVAGVVTPYGPRYLLSVLELSTMGAAGTGITEWQPTPITRPSVLSYTLLVAITLVAIALAADRDDLPDVVLVVAGALFGITATRNVAAGAIVVGVVGAPYLRQAYVTLRYRPTSCSSMPPNRTDRLIFRLICVAGLLAVLVAVPRSSALRDHVRGVPLDLIAQLDMLERPARVVTLSRWAPAVAALTRDHVTISVDGRLELFTDEEFDDYRTVEDASPGYMDVVARWCATDVLLPSDSPLVTKTSENHGWQERARRRLADREVVHLEYVVDAYDCPRAP